MTTGPTFEVHLSPAQRETLRRSAAGMPVAGSRPAPDVDVDDVIRGQLTRPQLATMTGAEVKRAQDEGRLLGITTPDLAEAFTPPAVVVERPAGQLGREHLAGMSHADIEAARASGQLEHVLSGQGEQ